ncbi:zinc-binding alcohol dehydrogenase family protein [Aeoliella sp. ICT_H6.2]|uniref:Zinc-binding alcohol dehydrogenase family protein n=1 Tax=Aeoliella straminimaris TaxID=2954799 RepID=A0A9X2JJ03_9BACT|nr:zinc-binding alcohol dehydrogenase family protein [Aeoliella straminimaris]MCO6046258.1 zinc-binding alcohol dehydrogenase family protein [Aeoliella straminimaris]
MKVLEIAKPGEVRLIERPVPQPGPGEVLLRVRTVGYCGTDLSTFRGANPLVEYPRIPGHEVAGTIEQFGADATSDLSVGQHVLVFPYTECERCTACQAGRPNCCQYNQTLGVQRDGALAEYACLPAEKLIAAPGLTDRDLALVEPLTVGAHAVARGQATEQDTVLVFGCGAIGLGVIAAAASRHARVIAVDIDDEKLALGEKCGAAESINSLTEDLNTRVAELTDGHGPHLVIEAVGLPQTFRASVNLVAFAGRVVYVGYAKAAVEYETKFFVMKELDIRGSRNALRRDFDAVIEMLQSGSLPVDEIVNRSTNLAGACEAMEQWSASPQQVTKIHITLD